MGILIRNGVLIGWGCKTLSFSDFFFVIIIAPPSGEFGSSSLLLDSPYSAAVLYVLYCVLCIYQIYGKHVGHKCELATNIATSTREELRTLSKKLGDHYDTIKKARKKVIDTKENILNTQQYVRNRILKHMGVLRACISRRETMLKCDVDDRTTRKTKPLDEQERYGHICISVYMT